MLAYNTKRAIIKKGVPLRPLFISNVIKFTDTFGGNEQGTPYNEFKDRF